MNALLERHMEEQQRARLVALVRERLASGEKPSTIATDLYDQHLTPIDLLILCKHLTGCTLGQAKAFGAWWGPRGVRDAESFDAYAHHLLTTSS